MKNIQMAYAKINLTLDVVGQFDNGYHDLKTVMQTVDLYDVVTVTKRKDSQVILKISGADLPDNSDNIAHKAASLMIDTFGITHGFTIEILKHIPIAAGLAGGSADGSAVIRAIFELEQLDCSIQELVKLAAKIGADLPFCLVGGTALCEGIGDSLTPIATDLEYNIVAVNNGQTLSTPSVFKALDFEQKITPLSSFKVYKALINNDYNALIDNMSNDLYTAAKKLVPQIDDVFESIKKHNPDIMQLSGSGPTVFALFKDLGAAHTAYNELKSNYNKTFLIKPIKEELYELPKIR